MIIKKEQFFIVVLSFIFSIILLTSLNINNVYAYESKEECMEVSKKSAAFCSAVDYSKANTTKVSGDSINDFIASSKNRDDGGRKIIQEDALVWIGDLIKYVISIMIGIASLQSLYVIIASIIQISATADMPFFRRQATEKLLKSSIILVLIPSAYFIFYAAIYFFGSQ